MGRSATYSDDQVRLALLWHRRGLGPVAIWRRMMEDGLTPIPTVTCIKHWVQGSSERANLMLQRNPKLIRQDKVKS